MFGLSKVWRFEKRGYLKSKLFSNCFDTSDQKRVSFQIMNRNEAIRPKTPQPLVHPLYLREYDEQKQKWPQTNYFQRFRNRIFRSIPWDMTLFMVCTNSETFTDLLIRTSFMAHGTESVNSIILRQTINSWMILRIAKNFELVLLIK